MNSMYMFNYNGKIINFNVFWNVFVLLFYYYLYTNGISDRYADAKTIVNALGAL